MKTSSNIVGNSLFIVGIGVSSRGLEGLLSLVARLPKNVGMGCVIVSHLSPQHHSTMMQRLSQTTDIKIIETTSDTRIERDTIYVTPPRQDVFTKNGEIRLRYPQDTIETKPSFNYFFTSLANDYQKNAIGVLLTNPDPDGIHGMRMIKTAGGCTIVQKFDSAEYGSITDVMSQPDAVDLVLTAEEIAHWLPSIISHLYRRPGEDSPARGSIADLIADLIADSQVVDELQPAMSDNDGISAAQDEAETSIRRRVLDLERELSETRNNLQIALRELATYKRELQIAGEKPSTTDDEPQIESVGLAGNGDNQENSAVAAAPGEKLHHSEQPFRDLAEGSIQGIYIHRNLKALFANQACVDIFGYDSIEDFLAVESVVHYYAEHEIIRLQEFYQTRMQGGQVPVFYEVDATSRDGSDLTLLQSARIIEWKGAGAIQVTLLDITERKRIELALKHKEALFRTIFSNSGAGISLAGPDGRIVLANEALCEMLGYCTAELQGRHLTELTHPEDVNVDIELFEQCLNRKRHSYHIEKRLLSKTDDVVWVELSITYSRAGTADGRAEIDEENFFVAIFTDITSRKYHEQAIEYQANYDALTGLPNRALFMDRLSLHIKRSTRDDSAIYVLFIDLDGFKDINDTLGHEAGDELLQQVAGRFTRCVRETDTIARFGGDEFVVMLSGGIEIYAVERVISCILQELHQPFRVRDGIYRVSASIGVTVYPHDTHDAGTLIQYAETAMYRAKEKERGGFVFFQSNMNDQVVERARVKQKIFEAIDNKEFVLHYHPIVDLRKNHVVGAEALVRWQHPSEGIITPDIFIPISEETGQIVVIGRWILEQAIQQLGRWRPLFGPGFYISVNISPRQLYENSLFEFIAELPDEDLSQLVFEITESIFLETHQAAVDTLQLIQKKGGKVSIDDFGTGYSSLQYLRTFSVDTVKIDQSFIRQHDTISAPNDAFIEAILALAQGISAKVVAEGVETIEQLEFLRSRACHSAQGFYFSRPMSEKDFERFMQSWSQTR